MYLIGDLSEYLELSTLPLQNHFYVLPGWLAVCRELIPGWLHPVLPCCIPGVCHAQMCCSQQPWCLLQEPSVRVWPELLLEHSANLTCALGQQCWRALIDPAVLWTKISCLTTRIAVTSFCSVFMNCLACHTTDFWFKQISSCWTLRTFLSCSFVNDFSLAC